MKRIALPVAVALAVVAQASQGAGFIEDSKANLALRTLYFNSDNRESQNYTGQHNELGQGFQLQYSSGFTEGTVGVGIDALATWGVRLDGGGRAGKAGQDRNPSQLFPLHGDKTANDFARLGLTAKAKVGESEIRYGTLLPRLPILVSNDGRLLPQTFHGTQITSKDFDNLTLTGGLIEQVTGRASTDRTGLSVAGATQESNHLWFAGADWTVQPGLLAQYYYANLEEFYRQHFFGLNQTFQLADNQSLKLDLRYFRTDAEGKNASGATGYGVGGYTRNGDGEIDNNTWSTALTYNHSVHTVMLGYQQVSEGSNFVQPNQVGRAGGGGITDKGAAGASLYLHTDRLLSSFNRAGERTVFADYTFSFRELGAPGLTAGVAYLRGSNIKTANGGNQQEWERDLRLDYALQGGPLQGMVFSWRNATWRGNTPNTFDTDQNRLIVSYSIPLL